jgi:hypothetical protein
MTWGLRVTADSMGPAINRSETFYRNRLEFHQAAALYANEAAFQATLTRGYQGPGDLFGEYSRTPNVANGRIGQMQYLAAAYTLCASPMPVTWDLLLNACRGQGPSAACNDIGLSGNGTRLPHIPAPPRRVPRA